MDFKERMEQMRQEMERRRQELNKRLDAYKSDSFGAKTEGNPDIGQSVVPSKCASRTQLIHHAGLEDESETKLGMFERLYSSYFPKGCSKSFQSFGYSDIDFSPLTNLLAGIGEIELYETLHHIAKETTGMILKRKKSTYGDFIELLRDSRIKQTLSRHNIQSDALLKQIREIKVMRNSSNHKGVVTTSLFDKFFKNYYVPFFNENLPLLLSLKGVANSPKNLQGDSCRSANTIAVKSEQEYVEMLDKLFSVKKEDEVPDKQKQICILWTNTEMLTLKYYQNVVVSVNGQGMDYRPIVINFLNGLLKELNEGDTRYFFLDAADPANWENVNKDESWQAHLRMLDQFRLTKLARAGINQPVSLFILGGDDVIPMPKLRNPLDNDVTAANKVNMLESSIEVDWLYSFQAKSVCVDDNGYLDMARLSNASTLFFVSRLPLESGVMESDLQDDFKRYFSKSLAYGKSMIKVGKVGAVAMETCKALINKTISGFPTSDFVNFEGGEEYRFRNSFISPKISLEVNSEGERLIMEYVAAIRECDLVTFDLHGTANPNVPFYIGEAADRSVMPPAFSKEILNDSKIRIMVPISCWGARYIGYRRETSMLLHAMYESGVLLFMGSCRSALGSIDQAGAPVILASMLLRLFMQNLLLGYPAGEALQRAKIDYMNNHSDWEVSDLLTVQEFNLYGDPTLRVQPCISKEDLSEDLGTLPEFSWDSYRYAERVMYRKHDGQGSLLDEVRGYVDRNLADIRNRMNNLLYKYYHVNPDTLTKISKFSANKAEGYRFVYRNPGDFPCEVMAYTDSDGNLEKVIHQY